MISARGVALRINGTQVTKATLRHGENELELVIADPLLGELVINESFTLELLELVHPHEIQSRLPEGGWRKVSLRILIALLRGGIVRVVEDG
jgi:hypothetical protein